MIDAVTRRFPATTRIARWWFRDRELPAGVDVLELARQARAEGVSIAPEPNFSATQIYRNFMRLSCAIPWDGRIEAAVALLARLAR